MHDVRRTANDITTVELCCTVVILSAHGGRRVPMPHVHAVDVHLVWGKSDTCGVVDRHERVHADLGRGAGRRLLFSGAAGCGCVRHVAGSES